MKSYCCKGVLFRWTKGSMYWTCSRAFLSITISGRINWSNAFASYSGLWSRTRLTLIKSPDITAKSARYCMKANSAAAFRIICLTRSILTPFAQDHQGRYNDCRQEQNAQTGQNHNGQHRCGSCPHFGVIRRCDGRCLLGERGIGCHSVIGAAGCRVGRTPAGCITLCVVNACMTQGVLPRFVELTPFGIHNAVGVGVEAQILEQYSLIACITGIGGVKRNRGAVRLDRSYISA